MLIWALIMLGVSVLAGLLGFGPVSSTAAMAAKILCVVFVFAFLTVLMMGVGRTK